MQAKFLTDRHVGVVISVTPSMRAHPVQENDIVKNPISLRLCQPRTVEKTHTKLQYLSHLPCSVHNTLKFSSPELKFSVVIHFLAY
jgi:hypothetical protein